jgi:hypothetical protein
MEKMDKVFKRSVNEYEKSIWSSWN